jgi:tellurite resistance protein
MKRTGSAIQYCLVILLFGTLIWIAPAGAQMQNAPAGSQMQPVPQPDRYPDLTPEQRAAFDQFLDSHPEVAQQLFKDPSLADNQQFVDNHPELRRFLEDHPEIRHDLRENPNAVMREEARYDRRPDITRPELATMDRFLDSHPEIAEQLRKDPSLVDNKDYMEHHPELQQFLAEHPELREQFKEHPDAFMRDEERFDRREDRPDITRDELANMDRFLESHPEIAEQLRKDPSLVNNRQFVDNHPAFQQFLAEHPELRDAYKDHPVAFMRDAERFDRQGDPGRRGDGDATRGELSSFHEFLESHGTVAAELSKNPSLATNQEYLETHSELSDYLKANPKVHEELSQNPQSFLASAQQFGATPKMPAAEPKVK